MKVFFSLLMILSFGFGLQKANAADLNAAQKAKLKEWQSAIDDKTGEGYTWPKDWCGKELPLKMDPSLVAPFMEAGNEAHFYCKEIRDKLATMCRNAKGNLKAGNKADNKALINAKVKRITCKISAGEEDDAKFELKDDGELVGSLGAKASNVAEKMYEYLITKKGFNNGENASDTPAASE